MYTNDEGRKIISVSDIIAAGYKAIEKRGEDYVYPGTTPDVDGVGCHYRWDSYDVDSGIADEDMVGKPACLVGAVFYELEVLDAIFPRSDDTDEKGRERAAFEHNEDGISDVVTNEYLGTVGVEYEAKAVLVEMQNAQDTGFPWGVALRRAIAKAQALKS